MSSVSFYVREGGGRFISTERTSGPWDQRAQHAGPPAALLGSLIEGVDERPELRVARITFDILKPIPVAPLDTEVHIERDGKSVQLVAASLLHDGRPVMRTSAWRIRAAQVDHGGTYEVHVPPGPETGHEVELFRSGPLEGYLDAMEWRFVKSGFVESGPGLAWARARFPLIDGEPITPLARALILADSASGVSAPVDFTKWFSINPDLSVYLHRYPEGEWVCLDAVTMPEPDGIGVCASTIYDERGQIGRSLQSLFMGPRP